ncbi:Cilia- and flagella-associated protein 61 [Eumeta japonica]|uniref:Cilia-and flagella-associated protein 61 n=1 Tax=Eumeta variegata TaxID=151549 RepID=A0A4C1ZQF0_EUMVA|nr:Cilia- and flagella-associated protein 61 [Eumeta japonica]
MVPIRPRRFTAHSGEFKDLRRESGKSTIFIGPFTSVWYMEQPITCMPQVDINAAIVVVGASNTALAFLETILTGPSSKHLRFTNITLVSEHGLPVVSDCVRAAETCVPHVTRYTEEYVKCMPFYYYVDVVMGIMETIDRQKKCIYIKGGIIKYYDELVLTCGKQFQHPDYLKESLQHDKELACRSCVHYRFDIGTIKHSRKGKPCERILMDDPAYAPDVVPPLPELPANVMIITSINQANVCMRRILKFIEFDGQTYAEIISI